MLSVRAISLFDAPPPINAATLRCRLVNFLVDVLSVVIVS
jgi:hypothetical protein